MNNVTNIENLEYKEAEEIVLSFQQRLHFAKRKLSFLSTVFVLLVYELFIWIINLFRPLKPKNVRGQLCLVTGGANGLGRHLALRFAQEGCNIAIIDIVNSDHTVKEIEDKFKVKCQGFQCDVSDDDSIARMKEEVEESMGPVDILVNNAGLVLKGHLLNCSIKNIQKCVDVNLMSHYRMVKTFLPGMIERKQGRIVAIASLASKLPMSKAPIYTSTKFGVDGFMEAIFDELCINDHDDFIKLTTVYPYFIATRQEFADTFKEYDDGMLPLTPQFVASEVVQGILKDKRKIIIIPSMSLLVIRKLPDRIIKNLVKSVVIPKN